MAGIDHGLGDTITVLEDSKNGRRLGGGDP